jgi:hypothetical protein
LYTPSVAQQVAALGSPVAAWVGELMAFRFWDLVVEALAVL